MSTPHLTAQEVADRWQRSRTWVTGQAKTGAIPGALKIGGFWRFPVAAIERYEARRATADPLSMTDRSAQRQGIAS